jgi:hypothetical protein
MDRIQRQNLLVRILGAPRIRFIQRSQGTLQDAGLARLAPRNVSAKLTDTMIAMVAIDSAGKS